MEKTLSQNSQLDLNTAPSVSEHSNSNLLKLTIAGLLILLPIVGMGGYYLGLNSQKVANVSETSIVNKLPMVEEATEEEEEVVCTMDVRICPDGSSVGRTGPNCEFTECPVTSKLTYTNTMYGYSIAYSEDWSLAPLSAGSINGSVSQDAQMLGLTNTDLSVNVTVSVLGLLPTKGPTQISSEEIIGDKTYTVYSFNDSAVSSKTYYLELNNNSYLELLALPITVETQPAINAILEDIVVR